MRLMLIGNPNTGKTTIFNHLTGGHRHIGNFAGVTVEYAIGHYGTIEIIDLPGIYSLEPYSKDEAVAVEFLKKHPPDGIINCIDISNLRRNLGLTLALTRLRIPMIIAANMLEEQREWDAEKLEVLLGIPVFPAHRKNRWVPAVMIRTILGEIKAHRLPPLFEETTMAARFDRIDQMIPPVAKNREREKSEKIDRFLLHPLWGTLLFIALMTAAFIMIFQYLAPFFSAPLLRGIGGFMKMAETLPQPAIRASIMGLISGVGSVISFLPGILLLFLFLAFLEDCGYMARICYLAENIMAVFGLTGRSVVPLLIGFGCTVPATLSARGIPSENQRKRTMRLLPFISCSAKLPVFGVLSTLLSPQKSLLIIPLLYLAGIGIGLIGSLFSFKGPPPFLMELPPYRMPRFSDLAYRGFARTSDFLKKIFTALLLSSISIALLQHFTPSFQWTDQSDGSILAHLAKGLSPFFEPIHLEDWRLICALAAGLFAKESTLSTLAVLSADLSVFHQGNLLPFLAFFLFYPPCIATLLTMKKESNSSLFPLSVAITHLFIAYTAAFLCSI